MGIVKSTLRSVIPTPVAKAIRRSLYRYDLKRRTASVLDRTCPICGFEGGFKEFGHPPRYDARCPSCRSLERHRLLFLAIERGQLPLENGGEGATMLHFAPEEIVSKLFRDRVGKYETADLFREDVDHQYNIEEIASADEVFDLVLASHVLEHVNDKKASSEIRRILKTGGTFVAMVPMISGWTSTYENDSVTDDTGRLHHYGQRDHVRFYGADFVDRIEESGLKLINEITAFGEDCVKYGLIRGEKIFVFSKTG